MFWMFSDCSPIALWPRKMKIDCPWQTWTGRTDARTNERTKIVTPRAPVGAKNHQLEMHRIRLLKELMIKFSWVGIDWGLGLWLINSIEWMFILKINSRNYPDSTRPPHCRGPGNTGTCPLQSSGHPKHTWQVWHDRDYCVMTRDMIVPWSPAAWRSGSGSKFLLDMTTGSRISLMRGWRALR